MSADRGRERWGQGCDLLLRAAAPLVPGDLRDDWLREWRAEVAWRLGRARCARWRYAAVAVRCLGALVHAAWLRWDRWRLEMLLQDVRYAFRGLWRRPAFTAVALGTLALGIGANTAIFGVVRAVLLKPLSFPSPEALVHVGNVDRVTGETLNLSPADFFDFARETTTVERMGANGWIDVFTVRGGSGAAERVGTVRVTHGFFPTLGVQPALGRVFTAEEDRPDGERVVLLTDGFWRRRFGGDPAIVGSAITVNALPTTVIGVLPASFRHIEERTDRTAEMFMLYQFDTVNPNRGGHFIRAIGRLARGRTIEDARAELGAIAERLEREYPQDNSNRAIHLSGLHEAIVGDSRPVLLLLLSAVGLVLLVVCANLANLLLAAGTGRLKELAVRSAVGAARGRLVRQLLTEALVLGSLGAAAGLALAWWITRALTALAAAGIPRTSDIGVDWSVMLYAVVVGVGASAVFGSLPALNLSAGDLQTPLRDGGRLPGTTVRQRARRLLIATEVALSVMLLVGAALLTGSLWRLQALNPGFTADRATVAEVSLPLARYPEGTQIPLYERLEARVAALPGVHDVGATNILPLSDNYDSRGIQIEDAPMPAGQNPAVQSRSVTPGYFRAMGIPLVRGRFFDARDREGAPLVVIVSESMVRRYWPEQDPIGRRITYNSGIPAEVQREVGGGGSREIVGVVGDVAHLARAESEPVPMFYTPHAQQPSYHSMTVIVRADAGAAALAPSLRAVITEIDREVPLSRVRALDEVLARSVEGPRMRATLLALFAVLAIVLAGVGVYGVVSYLVGQRTQEIGIRLALGAPAGAIVALLVADGMKPVAWGIGAGVLGAIVFSRLLRAMLFGITPTDISVYLAAAGTLALVGLCATIVPARRVLRIDPVQALKAG